MPDVIPQEYDPAVPVEALATFPNNPRTHDDDAIGASIDALGFFGAVLAQRSTGRIIAGHGRWENARRQGISHLPVLWVDVDDERARQMLLADNRTSDGATYDASALAAVLAEVAAADTWAGTGWGQTDLDALLGSLNAPGPDPSDPGPSAPTEPILGDPDDAPDVEPVEAPTRTRVGDVWALGPHRLAVGDSTDPDVVALVMDGGLADLVWTDPPYGVSVVGGTEEALTILNDDVEPEGLDVILGEAFRLAAAASKPGAAWFVTAAPGPLFAVSALHLSSLGIWRQTLMWLKDRFVLGHNDYHYRHEPILYGWTPGAPHTPPPDRTGDSVWEVARPSRSADHPTMKPVALVQRAVEGHAAPGPSFWTPSRARARR